MPLVKRPGSAEARIEPFEPSPAATLAHLIDLTSLEVPTVAEQTAKQTGTYKIGDNFYKYREGDKLPAKATYVDPKQAAKKAPAPENKQAPALENKADLQKGG